MRAYGVIRGIAIALNVVALAGIVWFYWMLFSSMFAEGFPNRVTYANLSVLAGSFAPLSALVALFWRPSSRSE